MMVWYGFYTRVFPLLDGVDMNRYDITRIQMRNSEISSIIEKIKDSSLNLTDLQIKEL
jgi:hypothetical protein